MLDSAEDDAQDPKRRHDKALEPRRDSAPPNLLLVPVAQDAGHGDMGPPPGAYFIDRVFTSCLSGRPRRAITTFDVRGARSDGEVVEMCEEVVGDAD